jgi:hypothetical protein
MCYSDTANLFCNGNTIFASTGVQQGDPLGPLLFALALIKLTESVQSADFTIDYHGWYLDDGILVINQNDIPLLLAMLEELGDKIGLSLNRTKIGFLPLDESSTFIPPYGILYEKYIKILGAYVVPNPADLDEIVLSKFVPSYAHQLNLLESISEKHIKFLLLRFCYGSPSLTSFLRNHDPGLLVGSLSVLDSKLIESIQLMLSPLILGPLDISRLTLPTKHGGLGIYLPSDISASAYLGSFIQSFSLQCAILTNSTLIQQSSNHIERKLNAFNNNLSSATPKHTLVSLSSVSHCQQSLFNSVISCQLMNAFPQVDDFTNVPTDECFSRIVHIASSLQYSGAWLGMFSSNKFIFFSNREFLAAVGLRLRLKLFRSNSLKCPSCTSGLLNQFGDHCLICKGAAGVKYRHDHIRDKLIQLCPRTVAVSREPNHLLPNSGDMYAC